MVPYLVVQCIFALIFVGVSFFVFYAVSGMSKVEDSYSIAENSFGSMGNNEAASMLLEKSKVSDKFILICGLACGDFKSRRAAYPFFNKNVWFEVHFEQVSSVLVNTF